MIEVWFQIAPEEDRTNRNLIEAMGLTLSGGNARGYTDYEGYITVEQFKILQTIPTIRKIHVL